MASFPEEDSEWKMSCLSPISPALRYLESVDIKSDRVRAAVNHTFAALA
jgi:hypothetical protein